MISNRIKFHIFLPWSHGGAGLEHQSFQLQGCFARGWGGSKKYQDGLKLLQLGHWIRNYKSLRIFQRYPVIRCYQHSYRMLKVEKSQTLIHIQVLTDGQPLGSCETMALQVRRQVRRHEQAFIQAHSFSNLVDAQQALSGDCKSLVCSPLRLHSVSPKLPTSLLAMVKCISSKIAAFDTHKLKKSNMNNMFINQRKGSIVAFSSTSCFLILLPAHFAATEGLLLGLNLRCAQLRVGTISEKSRQNSTHLCRGQAFWCRDPCCLVRRAVLLGACSLASPSRAKDLCATTYTRLV